MLVLLALGLTVALGPYDGPRLPQAVPDTVKFAVGMSGTPRATVRLRALHVPAGYVASFCTAHVCSRDRVDLALGGDGRARIELQYIKNEPSARTPVLVTVDADGAHATSIAFSRGLRS